MKIPFVAVLFFFTITTLLNAGEAVNPPGYVTSQVCAECHEREYADWSDSHHSWAWREPARENVLGDFNDATFEHKGFRYHFQTDNGSYFIVADSPDGEAMRYRVRYTVGVTPLQQYLVETGSGRLQALDVAWDTERKRWYHLYPTQDVSAGNGMHWMGSYKNWNARCAECHATDFQKYYEPLENKYSSLQAEIGVGCEACHGPGEAHLAWARQPKRFDRMRWAGVDALGLTSASSAMVEIDLCAACHSRREPLGADSPPPGAAFDDHYRLALLRDGLYFPDGQIRDEVYVYGSFLQSKMYASGVRCTHCHEPHGVALKLEGNALCTQCHNAQGNPAFPTLRKAEYDTPAHHFHDQHSDASACKNCHMPQRNYMVVDGRRDHSFRIPRPDLSVKLDTPDPCTQCHQGKTPEWAVQQIKIRFLKSRNGEPHFAELFAAAGEAKSKQSAHQLLTLASNRDMPAIVRASALQRMMPGAIVVQEDDLASLMNDESALVRMAAIGLQRSLSEHDRTKILLTLLSDPMRSVHIETAKAFLGMPEKDLPEHARIPLQKAMGELQRSLHAKADFPEIQMVLGGVALTMRNLPAATSAFRRAVEMDPQLIQAWLMLARIQAVEGDRAGVSDTLTTAIRKNPDSDELRQVLREMNSLRRERD